MLVEIVEGVDSLWTFSLPPTGVGLAVGPVTLAACLVLMQWRWRVPVGAWSFDLACYGGGLGLILAGQLHLLALHSPYTTLVTGGVLAQLAPLLWYVQSSYQGRRNQ